MEKIVEYNSFDDDIVPGDIVVFSDGTTKKTIKKIDGHKVTFTDGSGFDLFVVSIKGIIKVGDRKPKTITEPPRYVEAYDPFESLFETKKDIPVSSKEDYLTYQELFKLMESSDHSGLGFSKYFWHYTTLSNLLDIFNAGKFKSRYDARGSIPYDNEIHNDTSREVMSHNASWKTKTHVRFYLRPLNKSYFAWFKNLPELEQRLCCIVCIRKEALYASFKSTFLYYENAVTATDDVFDKKNKLNQHQKEKFRVNNLRKFNFLETYSIYDKYQDDRRSLYQEAEFLVWKELSFIFADRILFRTQDGLNAFLNKIKDNKEYNNIRNKCVVDRTYFGY